MPLNNVLLSFFFLFLCFSPCMLVLEASEVHDMRLTCRAGTSPEGGIVAKKTLYTLRSDPRQTCFGKKCTCSETWLVFFGG